MAPETYPFIEIAVLDEIREHFANGDALVVISPDLQNVIWANGQGAAALGYGSIDEILSGGAALGIQAQRQLMALDGFPAIGHGRTVSLRVAFGLSSPMLTFQASDVTLPRGEQAILLSLANGAWATSSEEEIAALAIKGLGDQTTHAAIVDASGTIVAASQHFGRLGLGDKVLGDLVREVRLERNRLVKRPAQTATGTIAAGMARLTDSPALHLLLAIEPEPREHATPSRAAPQEPAVPAAPVADAVIEDAAKDIVQAAPEHTEAIARPALDADLSDRAPSDAFRYTPSETPVRFVWKVDAHANFSEISPEFAAAVGPQSASIIGRPFREVAARHGFDENEEIAELLQRRDTWSGRTVMWPIEGTSLRVPIELAALPIYSRDRAFLGFRGFGVARMGDVVADAKASGKPLDVVAVVGKQAAAPDDAFNGEKPALHITPDTPDNIIPLKPQRGLRDDGRLNDAERNAFREIAERLRREVLADNPRREEAVPPGPAEAIAQPAQAVATPVEPAPAARSEALVPDAEVVGPGFARMDDTEADAPASTEDFAEDIREQVRQGVDTSILAALPLPVLIHRHGELLYANAALLQLTSYGSAQAINDAGGLSILFADDAEGSGDEDEAGMNLRRSDGSVARVQAHLQAVRWDENVSETGERALLLALSPQVQPANHFEMSERQLLQTRIDELTAILDTATDGVILLDSGGAIRSVNHSAAALFGYEPDEVTGKPFSMLFAVESQRAAMDYLNGLSEHGVASLLNDGREVIGRESQGRFIPLFMTIGKLDASQGYCVVLRDITHWKRAEEELLNAKREAERTSAQKSEFLARISHEIRTPLNAIIGFSELMADEKFGPIGSERYREYLNDISRSGNHVLSLVNDLLDISKIEAGAVEMEFEAVSLNDALTEAVAIMQPQANRERVIIRSSLTSRLPDIVADHRSITQIALNLLSNAIRFTGPGGQVIVSTSYEQSGDVLLRVRDTGIGMTRAEVEQALRPYKQITTPNHPRSDGTGLGLPLTKAMAEANRANFTIDSNPGRGTMVEITFPSTRVLAE
ncbi:PAS domain S-box protein [Phyllobacterium endophyticum]|uniref:histidine kinase n=1 Tax=Phyllobacterium endophyticum TaxID=1149773 RepID=A0A2P7B132_9HYPH|nr:PAS domain S-box protein [Phyllobacterium endophyticum]MBB3237723.1 PAS domain S-box-containing protein [Phyllobacterium endophyticum]PSH60179.1 PAS domain-containing sensor histidine kinase [Phyllobacterium endophyticum]TYR42346.1 PAS domain S-box protein [Phyllobacterium endophyticum]